jgi:hypothetical protein
MATALRAPSSPNQLQATSVDHLWPLLARQQPGHLGPPSPTYLLNTGSTCSQAAPPLRSDQQGDLHQLPISAEQLVVIAVLIDRHLGND